MIHIFRPLCKLAILFIVCFAFSITLLAAKVEIKTAKLLASNFFFEKAITNGYSLKHPEELLLTYTHLTDNEPIYYVFTASKGFIIVAADDDVYPVLSYSFDGHFTLKNVSPEYKFWMNSYEEQIIHVRNNALKADENIKKAWLSYTNDFNPSESIKGNTKGIAPLLMSTWDQGTYYNFLCPEDPAGPDGHVWSGCVATAMAQVMYYYRYPSQGTGAYGYNSDYGYLSANFGNTTYNWNHMQNNISGKYNYDMALLQLHCGIAIDMGYSPDGSGAYMNDDVNAMKTYFGYSSSTQLYYRSNYNNTSWANLLKGNLDNKMPIQYAGYGDGGGHAFVCDGYQGTDFFHFNWGWSGSFNGYYYLNNLNPGYTFNDGQQAILNSYPATNYPQYCSGTKVINSMYGTIEDGSSPRNDYQNNSDCMWLIAPTDAIDYIRLNFDRLNTEPNNDRIIIYDGETTADSVIGIVSGNTLPPEIKSTGKKVLIHFITDNANVADGWLLSYTSQITKFCTSLTELTAPSGIITDGSEDYNYNNSTICRWRIAPPDAGSITLNFNSFDLASDYDFMKIYDEEAGVALMTYQGQTLPQSFTAYTGKVLILFLSSPINNAQGWEIYYESAPATVSENDNSYVSIFPNPATGFIRIEATIPSVNSLSVEMFNNIGCKVYSGETSCIDKKINQSINVSHLAKGLYYLKLSSENFNHTQKLIIR